ncbi:MAG TPA: DUF1127 domain-containing protein [Dongiaceae bacterium]|nr:DUF1127 domain-containing protein [Dongiaceae bacterium]
MMMQNYSVRRHIGASEPSGSLGVLSRAARLITARLTDAWARHRDENLLQTLSDHQLRDLGIGRGDISRVVRHGRGW